MPIPEKCDPWFRAGEQGMKIRQGCGNLPTLRREAWHRRGSRKLGPKRPAYGKPDICHLLRHRACRFDPAVDEGLIFVGPILRQALGVDPCAVQAFDTEMVPGLER